MDNSAEGHRHRIHFGLRKGASEEDHYANQTHHKQPLRKYPAEIHWDRGDRWNQLLQEEDRTSGESREMHMGVRVVGKREQTDLHGNRPSPHSCSLAPHHSEEMRSWDHDNQRLMGGLQQTWRLGVPTLHRRPLTPLRRSPESRNLYTEHRSELTVGEVRHKESEQSLQRLAELPEWVLLEEAVQTTQRLQSHWVHYYF